MGSSLINTTPANTYPALIKVGDNTSIDATLKTLSDGNGNNLPIQASSSTINFTGTTTGLPFQDFALYPYTVVVATVGGTISTITSATSPSGANLVGATGWAFTVSGVNVAVTHPLGNTIFLGMSRGINAANICHRQIIGSATSQYAMFQNSASTVLTVYSCTASNAAFNGAASVSNALTLIFFSTVYS